MPISGNGFVSTIIDIGQHAPSGGAYLNGTIDEFRISNIARTPDEIKRNFEGGLVLRSGELEFAKSAPGSDPGCVGYWSFDEGSGDTAYDGSGNGNDGTIHGGENWTEGRFGRALEFDGEDDYIQIPDSPSFDTTFGSKIFTLETWVYCREWVNHQGIISKRDNNLYATQPLGLYADTNGISGVMGSSSSSISVSNIPLLNEWHHIVFTGDGNDMFLYVDGFIKDQNEINLNPVQNNDNLQIGYFYNQPNGYFNGLIDEVAIYNRALTPSEISQHYNRTQYPTNASLTSTLISLPVDMNWSTASVAKSESPNTRINVSIIDNATNQTITGFDNITSRNIDLTPLNELAITSIRLLASFHSNGSATPSLDSWGVEWNADNTWRDSFTGTGKSIGDNGPPEADEHTVGLWHFEEGAGNNVSDSSGKGNHGTKSAPPSWTNGKFGGGMKFGENWGDWDHHVTVDAPVGGELDFIGPITAEAWINPSKLEMIDTNRHTIADRYYSWGLFVNTSATDVLPHAFFLIYDSDENQRTIMSRSVITTDKWTHIAGVYDDANDVMKIYIDGVLDHSRRETGGVCTALNNYPVLIGNGNIFGGTASPFLGTIDEVRVSNVARSPREMADSYESGVVIRGGQAQLADNEIVADGNTSALWHFNEGDGNVLHDSSGNGNDGVIYGANWTEGVMGGALEFDGENDYVDVENDHRLDVVGGNFTVEIWTKWSFTGNNGQPWQIIQLGGYENKMFIGVGKDADKVAFGYKNGGSTPWQYDIGSDLNDGKWHQLVTVKKVNEYEFYIDGVDAGLGRGGTASTYLDNNLIGKGGFDHFNGIIDEISIYNRALAPSEIRTHATRYRYNATLRSEIITLPDNNSWSTFHCNRIVPDDTYLNISIQDAATNETLLTEYNRTDYLYINLSGIDPAAHPSIYLQASFQSNRTETPILHDWAVNWTVGAGKPSPPELTGNLPAIINITEDIPEADIIDLADVFYDRYSQIDSPTYGIEFISDPDNISLALNGSRLDVVEMEANWSGSCSVRLNCTNVHGLNASTPLFAINARPIDDAPAWTGRPPPLTVIHGQTNTSNYTLPEYVTDAEGDPFDFQAYSPDLEIEVDGSSRLAVTSTGNFSGDTTITVKVFEIANASLFSNASVRVTVLECAHPAARLLSPRNGTTITETTVELRWDLLDSDTDLGNVTFDVYFGDNEIPPLYASDVSGHNFTVSALSNGTIYYWYVIPRDILGPGTCPNGTWHFTVNTERPLPKVTLRSPANDEIMNTTTVELEWKVDNPLLERLTFNVYLGLSQDNLTLNVSTEEMEYELSGLQDETTYFWKVIPWNENITGVCVSGIRNFTVRKDFQRHYSLHIEVPSYPLEVVQGTIGRFDINITNLGNHRETVDLSFKKYLLDSVALDPSELSLDAGGKGKFQLQVSVGRDFLVSSYKLDIIASIGTTSGSSYTITHTVAINVTPGEGTPDDGKPGGGGLKELLKDYWEVPVVILSALAALFGYLQLRKRKNKFQSLRREIETTYEQYSNRCDDAISELQRISDRLTEYMDRQKITDNQYIILDRKINDYTKALRATSRLTDAKSALDALPSDVRKKVEVMLEDGKLTRQEFDELKNVMWDEEVTEADRERIGSFAARWLEEDTGEHVEWSLVEDEGEAGDGTEVDADIVHVPGRTSMDKSFVDIVRETHPQPVTDDAAPGLAGSVSGDAAEPTSQLGVVMPYAFRGRLDPIQQVIVGKGEDAMEVHLPGLPPEVPPVPGVSMPDPAPLVAAEETKALPQGDVLATVSGILEGIEAQPGPAKSIDGTPAPPLPGPGDERERLPGPGDSGTGAALPPPSIEGTDSSAAPPPLPPPE